MPPPTSRSKSRREPPATGSLRKDPSSRPPVDEDQLVAQRTWIHALVDAAPDGMYVKDLQGRFLLANEAVSRMTGKSQAELQGESPSDLFPPEEAAQIVTTDRQVLESRTAITVEQPLTDHDGVTHWYSTTKGPLFGEDGALIGVYGVSRDITARKRVEMLLAARSRLLEFALAHTLDELLEETLNEAEALTGSLIGFYHFIDDDERQLTLSAWSTRTKAEFCRAAPSAEHYPIPTAGVWVDCVRQRVPVIHNDYASLPHRKGMPEGHAQVIREAVVPVFRGAKIRAVIGVGNKSTSYTQDDVETVSGLADLALDFAERKLVEDRLIRQATIDRALLEQAPVAIGAHRHGKGLFANEAHRKMFGYASLNDVVSLDLDDMVAPQDRAAAREMIRKHDAGESVPDSFEFMAMRADGSTFPVLLRGAKISLPDGPATIMFHVDLTERVAAEAALRASEEKFARTFAAAPMMVGLTDLETGVFLDVNEECLRVSGYSRDEVIGHSAVEVGFMKPEDRARLMAALQTAGRASGLEMTFRAKDGRPVPALVSADRIQLGGRDCLVSTSLDITDHRRAEEALAESRAIQDAVVDSTVDWIWAVDSRSFGFLSLNRSFREYVRRTRGIEPKLGMSPGDVFETGQQRRTWENFYRRALGGPFETEYAPSADIRLHLSFQPLVRDGETFGISVFGRDVTEARRADEALQQSEARFRAVSENALSGIAIVEEGRLRYVNPAFAATFEYERDELLGTEILALIHPDDRPTAQEAIRLGIEGKVTEVILEIRGVRKDGALNRVLILGSRFELDGRTMLLANVLDTTDQRRLEANLRESEARFRAVSEFSLSGISIIENGRFTYANPAFCAISGYEREELLDGVDVLDLVAPADRELTREAMRRLLAGEVESLVFEYQGLKKDGSLLRILNFASRIELEGRVLLLGNVLDMTERERLQDNLRQSQKMEAVGRLAGGVAHDFNNLLTAIGGYARLLEDDLARGEGSVDDARQIVQAAERASALTSRLLAFSGRRAAEPVDVALDAGIRQIVPILRRLVPERIELIAALEPTPVLHADPTELDQVVLNLVVNAVDSIPATGRIAISTETVSHDDEFVRGHVGARAGSHARLTVSDTGAGMDEATRSRIFEPFFTTKGFGEGTGLGLSTVYGVVTGLGGTIEVRSAPGAGTTFEIDLPAAAATPGRPEETAREPLPAGNERILLVEDDPAVRQFASAALQRLGYSVRAVSSPVQALEIDPADYDMVVSDVVMPGMDGRELVATLRARTCGLAAILVSGYAPDAAQTAGGSAGAAGAAGAVSPPGTGAVSPPGTGTVPTPGASGPEPIPVLPKPFSQAQLARAVRVALDAARRGRREQSGPRS